MEDSLKLLQQEKGSRGEQDWGRIWDAVANWLFQLDLSQINLEKLEILWNLFWRTTYKLLGEKPLRLAVTNQQLGDLMMRHAEHLRAAQQVDTPFAGYIHPRVALVELLYVLLRRLGASSDGARVLTQTLAGDPRIDVRQMVLARVHQLMQWDKEFFWRVIEGRAETEQDPKTLELWVHQYLPLLFDSFPDRSLQLLRALQLRARHLGLDGVAYWCVVHLCRFYIDKNRHECLPWVMEAVSSERLFPDEAQALVQSASRCFENVFAIADFPRNPVFERGISMLESCLGQLERHIRNYEAVYGNLSAPIQTKEQEEAAKAIAPVLQKAAAGVIANLRPNPNELNTKTFENNSSSVQLFDVMCRILDHYSFTCSAYVIHSMVETITLFVDVRPREVFLLLEKYVRAGETSDYQYEPMAMRSLDRLVRMYLTAHRDTIVQYPDCSRALVTIMGIFLRVGRPEAYALSKDISAFFR